MAQEIINMSINYKQLQEMVKEAMHTGGGIMEPSAPEGIPHRMPAADTGEKEQDMGDPKANDMYDIALEAREAAERLVEALDDPAFDDAYEHAFKASACLRKALNSLEGSGAHPMPDQRVVAPPPGQQRYTAGGAVGMGDFFGGAGAIGMGGLQEVDSGLKDKVEALGAKNPEQLTQTIQDVEGMDPGDKMILLQHIQLGKEA